MKYSRAIGIGIAAEAHAGQVDRAGIAYILHLLRVMLSVDTDEERIVAVMHDVCEDCPSWSLARLESEGFLPHILKALETVTKREREPCPDVVVRAGSDRIGLDR